MAERRMFTGKITESDVFLEMPLSSQCLYFHLCMYADDEGFVKNPKRIQRMIGATDDDFRVLNAKNFVLRYESGIIVIKHWKMHNLIRKDRFHPTEYTEEKSMLYIKENGAYTLDPNKGVPLLATKWQPNDNQMGDTLATEVRLGKDRLDKVNKKSRAFTKPTLEEVKAYCEERQNGIDAETFIDFYECKGWMVGKTHMKDWKAAVRTWEKRRNGEANGRVESISRADEEQRNREIDEYYERVQAGEFDHDDDGLWD